MERLLKDDFFDVMQQRRMTLSYDEVLVRPQRSDVAPWSADISTMFTRNVPLRIPIASAAMDTVTEHEMAIAMARLGGIGIIHRNLSPQEQAAQVAKVKFFLNGFIEKPITVHPNDTIESIVKRKNEKGYQFSSFPVVDEKNVLIGLISGSEFDFAENDQVVRNLMVPLGSMVVARPDATIDDAYRLMRENRKKVLPIVDEDNVLRGLYLHSDLKRIKEGSGMQNVDKGHRLIVGAAVGIGGDAEERLELLARKHVDVVVVDTAHAHNGAAIEFLRRAKQKYAFDIMIGNVSTYDAAHDLLDADGIKVGQGPGSICTTRIVTGSGRAQLTAVYECAKAARESGVPVCADGGIKYSGDIVKAIGAGAHSVMLGSILAATEEAPGGFIEQNGVKYKFYRGMGSLSAMQESAGSRERYRQGGGTLVPEGVEGGVEYAGPLSAVLGQMTGGLKSGMGMAGTPDIAALRRTADFDYISDAGRAESHPHSLKVMTVAPNYRGRSDR